MRFLYDSSDCMTGCRHSTPTGVGRLQVLWRSAGWLAANRERGSLFTHSSLCARFICARADWVALLFARALAQLFEVFRRSVAVSRRDFLPAAGAHVAAGIGVFHLAAKFHLHLLHVRHHGCLDALRQ